MDIKRRLLIVGLILLLAGGLRAAENDRAGLAGLPTPRWNVDQLSRPPATYPATEPTAKDVRSLFYKGLSFQEKPTRVFAYYGAPNVMVGKKVPGIVLVHGGGGTAFDAWVRLWNSRGYAGIAMDLCGCVPRGTYNHWTRHEAGGPPGWGGFDQIDWPAEDQWTYHAVADILLAHSLLRSFPEVDPQRIGLTGISWGGYLTCIAAGVDRRFRFAVPVYGCGFLGDDSYWLPQFKELGPERAARWLNWWDPSVYLKQVRVPLLWVTGTNDFAYPLDSLQKSYRLPHGPRMLCLRVRMPHAHGGPGENPEEIHAFANALVQDGVPLAKITGQGREHDQVWATFETKLPLKQAELNFTKDSGQWQDRKWETVAADVDSANRRVTARLPADVTVYYLNLIDQRNLVVSTEHEEVAAAKPAQ